MNPASQPAEISPVAARTASMLLRGAMRTTAARLLDQGLSAEDVATALDIPIEALSELIEQRARLRAPGGSSDAEARDRIAATERGLGELSTRAIEVIGEIMECGDSGAVRLAAAKFALEGAHGSLRPKRDEGASSMQQINFIFNEANQIYREQLARCKPASVEIADVEPVRTHRAQPKDLESAQLSPSQDTGRA